MLWLIAEDEMDIRMLVAMMCQVWGHTTLLFETGQKAWDWLDEVESGKYTGALPEFVLMDIRMPGKKGNEVARRIRSLSPFARVPIVLMTAYALSESERASMMKDDGVDHIINKPLPDFEDLRVLLHNILARKQKETASAAQPAAPPTSSDGEQKTDSAPLTTDGSGSESKA